MKYFLEPQGDNHFAIGNYVSDCAVGYVALRGARYHVENVDSEEIAIVRSLDDAIPAIAAYHEKNPPRWECESKTRYSKLTQFGPLRVEQDQSGHWLAYRNDDHPLLRNGQPAIFATFEEAQRTADAHASDGYPNSEMIYDGFAYVPNQDPWWSYPNRIAVRTRWLRRTLDGVTAFGRCGTRRERLLHNSKVTWLRGLTGAVKHSHARSLLPCHPDSR